jgi:hypothetical protein
MTRALARDPNQAHRVIIDIAPGAHDPALARDLATVFADLGEPGDGPGD